MIKIFRELEFLLQKIKLLMNYLKSTKIEAHKLL
jgi:hypothetical protein